MKLILSSFLFFFLKKSCCGFNPYADYTTLNSSILNELSTEYTSNTAFFVNELKKTNNAFNYPKSCCSNLNEDDQCTEENIFARRCDEGM